MRLLKTLVATVALLAFLPAPPASALEAYASAFTLSFYAERWPCAEGCTNSWDHSWAKSTFTGVSGGPDWNDAFNIAPVTISYYSVNCTEDWYSVRIDASSGTSDGGANLGVLDLSLHRVGSLVEGSATFTSNSGTGSGTYALAAVSSAIPDAATAQACIGGPRALAWFGFSGVMAHVTL